MLKKGEGIFPVRDFETGLGMKEVAGSADGVRLRRTCESGGRGSDSGGGLSGGQLS